MHPAEDTQRKTGHEETAPGATLLIITALYVFIGEKGGVLMDSAEGSYTDGKHGDCPNKYVMI